MFLRSFSCFCFFKVFLNRFWLFSVFGMFFNDFCVIGVFFFVFCCCFFGPNQSSRSRKVQSPRSDESEKKQTQMVCKKTNLSELNLVDQIALNLTCFHPFQIKLLYTSIEHQLQTNHSNHSIARNC